MKHKKHSIRSYSKDISEAHESFYKLMKGHLILAWFLKKNKNTKDTYRMNGTNPKTYRYLLKKDGMPLGASPSLDA